ncbi:MAG: c-type cytochrome biogenesis protein CcmI [Alphaproteobacteria bacterium]|nr:c-type cytochrome biogenesis protein CcmI [Alphaproteobacteria bacterium]
MLELVLALLSAATVGVLLIPLLGSRFDAKSRFEGELGIYRDQLAEIERERTNGILAESEAAAARTEVERRILAAADQAAAVPSSKPPSTLHKVLPPGLALAVPLLALGLYLQLGHPGLPSAPFARGSAPAEEPHMDIARLVVEARARATEHPDDPEAQAALGEALTLEADGTVTQPALEAFNKALQRNPGDPRTLYYLGLHQAQSGDSAAALARWRDLLTKYPDAPFAPGLRAEIERVARAAGVDPGLPPAPTGPSREQQDTMAKLSPAERQQAIRGMVEGLAERLKENPQDRAGWLRLANAWKVLGENANAVDAYVHADSLAPVDARQLADWAEAYVRQLKPGDPPPPAAVAVLERLEKAEPRNGLALFYLGAASFASGDKQAAARRWKALLSRLPPDAPIREMLEQRIKEAEAK